MFANVLVLCFRFALRKLSSLPKKFTGKLKYSTCYRQYFVKQFKINYMKTSLQSIKIEMTYEDGKQLKEQLLAMINDIKGMSEALSGYFDEAHLRETYPKVNEFLQVINVRDELPF